MVSYLNNLEKGMEQSLDRCSAIIEAMDTLHIRGYVDCKTYSNICEAIVSLKGVIQQMKEEADRFKDSQEKNIDGDANGNDN